jgi:hypothetical protein
MLVAGMFLAALVGAGEQRDCGFVAGERYWITMRGIVFPDGHLLEDYRPCIIPEGVVLAVLWDETPDISQYVIETHASCAPLPNEAEEVAALVIRARKALDAKGIAAADVPVYEGACAERRRVDVKAGL